MIRIAYDDEQELEDELRKLVERAVGFVAEREGNLSFDYEVSLFFAEKDEIRLLNAKYRDIDEPTDVLSFPMLEIEVREPIKSTVPVIAVPVIAAPILLGDIVICREVAEKQAEEYGHSAGREIVFLFIHGLLHLFGKDHGEEMRAGEVSVLENLGLLND